MTSRDTQDVILRLLADGPFRAAALANRQDLPEQAGLPPGIAGVVSRLDLAEVDRFGRFLCRHFYRERIVHYFKYCRALAPLTGRPPERALKTPEFSALVPRLVIGERASAEAVLDLLKRNLTEEAETIRAKVPYWDDLIAYQGAFFLSDALPPPTEIRRFAARSEATLFVELFWDLPAILPALLRPFEEPATAGKLPMPRRQPTRLLFARSPHGEVTAVRCVDALKDLLDRLTGEQDPAQVAAQMGIDPQSFEKTMQQLEKLGAVVAHQDVFSSSHVGSDLPPNP